MNNIIATNSSVYSWEYDTRILTAYLEYNYEDSSIILNITNHTIKTGLGACDKVETIYYKKLCKFEEIKFYKASILKRFLKNQASTGSPFKSEWTIFGKREYMPIGKLFKKLNELGSYERFNIWVEMS